MLDLSLSLVYPVLLLLRAGDRTDLSPLRDRVWDTWGVPVFEQRRDAEGHLVAWECEAHDMLHATERFTGPTLYRDECGCGMTGVRLVIPEKTTSRMDAVHRASAAD